jgi:hypothetical protein
VTPRIFIKWLVAQGLAIVSTGVKVRRRFTRGIRAGIHVPPNPSQIPISTKDS